MKNDTAIEHRKRKRNCRQNQGQNHKEGYRKNSNIVFKNLGSRTRKKSAKKRNNQLQLI